MFFVDKVLFIVLNSKKERNIQNTEIKKLR